MEFMPHRHIGTVICIGYGGTLQVGTGMLISKNLVLTCAHVIHVKEYNAFFPEIYFYPGQYGPFAEEK
jgi:V8-like Glu-specific endopeptidase